MAERERAEERKVREGPEGAGPATAGGRAARSDEEIRREIEASLAVDAGLEGAHVQVHVEGGVATLTGTVMSGEDRGRVEDLARSARGVREVRNRVETVG